MVEAVIDYYKRQIESSDKQVATLLKRLRREMQYRARQVRDLARVAPEGEQKIMAEDFAQRANGFAIGLTELCKAYGIMMWTPVAYGMLLSNMEPTGETDYHYETEINIPNQQACLYRVLEE